MDSWAQKCPVSAWKTVEDIFQNEAKDVQKSNKAIAVLKLHGEPLTHSVGESVHGTWQGKCKLREWREGEKEDSIESGEIKLVWISWAMATEINRISDLKNLK
jgi:hypothetical protein